jgi:hypothetical protein
VGVGFFRRRRLPSDMFIHHDGAFGTDLAASSHKDKRGLVIPELYLAYPIMASTYRTHPSTLHIGRRTPHHMLSRLPGSAWRLR